MDSYANYLIGAGVPNDRIDECMEWAFGDGWTAKDMGDCKDYWNRKRPFFRITGEMAIGETLYKIGKLFLAYERRN